MRLVVPSPYATTISRAFASRPRIAALDAIDGDVADWPPERLLLAALGLSMLRTLEALAARDGIDVVAWTATLTGQVERSPEGLGFTSIVVGLDLELTGNVDAIEQTLEDTRRSCLVTNSLRVPIVVETTLHTPLDQQPLRRVG